MSIDSRRGNAQSASSIAVPSAAKAAEGTAMELADCAFPRLESIDIYDDARAAFDGVGVALLVGARPRGPGMERGDLLEANGGIFGPQGEAINGGRPAPELLERHWIEHTFIPTVAKRGAAIIEARGASSAASAANAAIDHMRSWVLGTPDGDWTSAAVVSDGSYGVPEGLVCSYPVVSRTGAWEIVQGLELDDLPRRHIDRSVAELVEERDAVRALGLVRPEVTR